jgi:hypothetical protein
VSLLARAFPPRLRPRPTGAPMAIFEVWDIAKVPFPYTDRPVRQRPPALVVAAGEIEAAHGLLWLVMITSAENRGGSLCSRERRQPATDPSAICCCHPPLRHRTAAITRWINFPSPRRGPSPIDTENYARPMHWLPRLPDPSSAD